MSDYIVPVKQIVSWQGMIYGAGDRVPGYSPPEVKRAETPTKQTKPVDKTAKED